MPKAYALRYDTHVRPVMPNNAVSLKSLVAVAEARVGKLVELEVDAPDEAEARTQLERMCQQLLANPLIESYEIEFRGQG